MTLPADQIGLAPITSHQVLATGHIATFVEDQIEVPAEAGVETVRRQFVNHPGAVAVIALDADDRVACVRQYRHPAGMTMVEPPAGLLDHPGEDPWAAARRELAEEAELAADDWSVLVDVQLSPGGSSEAIRIFLARDLHPTDRPEGFVLAGEEYAMDVVWYPLSDLVEAILTGAVSSPSLIAGVLGLQAARTLGRELRPADAAWPARDAAQPRLVELADELSR